MNIAKNSRKQLNCVLYKQNAITKRNLLKIRIKFLKQQFKYRRVHNDDHYRHKRRKKINRVKESSEQKIAIYRILNI